MKIVPTGAVPPTTTSTNAKSDSYQSAKARAIANLLGTPSAEAAQPSAPQEASASSESPNEQDPIGEEKAQMHSQEEASSPVPKEATEVKEEPLSSQYALLARKEKAIRQREQALKAKEIEMKAKEQPMKVESKPEFDSSKYVSREALEKDPFGVLTSMGLTYDQLTEAALNGPKAETIAMNNELKALREELKALKSETETTKKTFEDHQSKQYKQGLAQIKSQASKLIDSNPEFETIKETGSTDDVVDLIEQTLKEDGILMTVEEAARQVEEYLVEEALKLARIKKIQQKLAPKALPESAKLTDPNKKQEIKTLTNAVASSRQLSARERATLVFEGKLNK